MTVLGKIIIETGFCINRCDGLINNYQENPSCNTINLSNRKRTVTSTGIKDFKLEREKSSKNTGKSNLETEKTSRNTGKCNLKGDY